jgi:hypothetical protein
MIPVFANAAWPSVTSEASLPTTTGPDSRTLFEQALGTVQRDAAEPAETSAAAAPGGDESADRGQANADVAEARIAWALAAPSFRDTAAGAPPLPPDGSAEAPAGTPQTNARRDPSAWSSSSATPAAARANHRNEERPEEGSPAPGGPTRAGSDAESMRGSTEAATSARSPSTALAPTAPRPTTLASQALEPITDLPRFTLGEGPLTPDPARQGPDAAEGDARADASAQRVAPRELAGDEAPPAMQGGRPSETDRGEPARSVRKARLSSAAHGARASAAVRTSVPPDPSDVSSPPAHGFELRDAPARGHTPDDRLPGNEREPSLDASRTSTARASAPSRGEPQPERDARAKPARNTPTVPGDSSAAHAPDVARALDAAARAADAPAEAYTRKVFETHLDERQNIASVSVSRLTLAAATSAGTLTLPELGRVLVRARPLAGSLAVDVRTEREETALLLRAETLPMMAHVREAHVPLTHLSVEPMPAGQAPDDAFAFGARGEGQPRGGAEHDARKDPPPRDAQHEAPRSRRFRFVL